MHTSLHLIVIMIFLNLFRGCFYFNTVISLLLRTFLPQQAFLARVFNSSAVESLVASALPHLSSENEEQKVTVVAAAHGVSAKCSVYNFFSSPWFISLSRKSTSWCLNLFASLATVDTIE